MNKYIIVGKAASGKDWLQRRLVEKGTARDRDCGADGRNDWLCEDGLKK